MCLISSQLPKTLRPGGVVVLSGCVWERCGREVRTHQAKIDDRGSVLASNCSDLLPILQLQKGYPETGSGWEHFVLCLNHQGVLRVIGCHISVVPRFVEAWGHQYSYGY